MDITHLPMTRGFVDPVAVVDWFSRRVLARRDHVFVEWLWRSFKYEEAYRRAYDSLGEARTSIERYLAFYNR